MKNNLLLSLLVISISILNGCAVVSAVDATVSTAIDVAGLGVKGTVAVVGAVIPDGDEDE